MTTPPSTSLTLVTIALSLPTHYAYAAWHFNLYAQLRRQLCVELISN